MVNLYSLILNYDTNKSDPDANVQFVSSYFVSELLSRPEGSTGGLSLDTGNPTLVLSDIEFEGILNFIYEFNVLEIKLVGADSCGRNVYNSKTRKFYKDAKSSSFPDSFFTTDCFEGEPDSSILKRKFKIVHSF